MRKLGFLKTKSGEKKEQSCSGCGLKDYLGFAHLLIASQGPENGI